MIFKNIYIVNIILIVVGLNFMAYLRCPECLFTNTVKKQEASTHVCCECGFEVGKYYYSEKSQKEADKFIVEENLRIKKLKAKIYRENRKKEQNNYSDNVTGEINSTTENTFYWDSFFLKLNLVLVVIMLALIVGIASKFLFTEQTQLAVISISNFTQNFIYSPILKSLFDSTISVEPGFFHELRLFLVTTSRGLFTLTLSLVVLLIYLFSIFAYLKSSKTFIDEKMIYPTLPILIFTFSVAFTSPNAAINEFGQMWVFFIYLVFTGINKLINKLI